MKRLSTLIVLALLMLPAYSQTGKGWSKYGFSGTTETKDSVKVSQEKQKERTTKASKPSKAPKKQKAIGMSIDASAPQPEPVKETTVKVKNTSTATKPWFIGGQMGPNFAVADNITDHPTFKYFGDALGLGFDVYVGKFFTPSMAGRLVLGYSNVKNRGDSGYVDITKKDAPNGLGLFPGKPGEPGKVYSEMFKGNGFYHFGVFDLSADIMFDFVGSRAREFDKPFHILGFAGTGLLSTGEKKLNTKNGTTSEETERMLNIIAGDPKSVTTFAFRLGLIFDYRFNSHFSLNFEGNMSITGDKFDGIDYDEPVDFLIKTQLGVTYRF